MKPETKGAYGWENGMSCARFREKKHKQRS